MAGLTPHLKAMGDNVRPGQRLVDAITSVRLNAIMGAIRALARGDNLVAGLGLRKSSTAEGAILTAEAARGGSTATTHPFQVVNRSSATVVKVEVVFGQVNSVTPTINGVGLDEEDDEGDPPRITLSSERLVYLDVTVDAGVVTGALVWAANVLPSNTSTHGYLTLATITYASGRVSAINQSVTHSLGHQKRGTNLHQFWGL